MAFKMRIGRHRISAGFTKPKAKLGTNANKIHAFQVPHSADKINSTKGYGNRKRLARENKMYNKAYNNTYNAETQMKKSSQALKYATANNLITQGLGGQTARDIVNTEARVSSAQAGKMPGSSQSTNNPADISQGGSKPPKTDSTVSMGWIK